MSNLTVTSHWSTHPWVEKAQSGVRYGIAFGPASDWIATRDMVQMAEDLGYDSYWSSDHPLLGLDCWTKLAGLSLVTQRIRLGSLVNCVCYRHPVLLAQQATDVDIMSQGRAMLGLGIGDFAWEFQQMNIPFHKVKVRQEMLEDSTWGISI